MLEVITIQTFRGINGRKDETKHVVYSIAAMTVEPLTASSRTKNQF